MSDNDIRHQGPSGNDPVPDAVVVEKRSGFSIVWLIPLVAALIGAWLAYKTLSEQGPVITLAFREGTGLEAGKTKIKYKALEVGVVETVQFGPDLSDVIVTARMNKEVERHLGQDSRFWVVRPRVGLGGVSGLETVVSGTYIEVEFGGGKPARTFTGLEQPPIVRADTPGHRYLLLSDKLGSIQRGSPIYFRDIQVGEVLTTQLAEDKRNVLVHVFVNAPYDRLVRDQSRFWKTSGFEVSLGAQGIDVKMESLLSVLLGGIAFDSPAHDESSAPSQNGAQFRLYDSVADIAESSYTRRDPYMMYFEGSVRGLSVGAPVEIRGLRIGKVTEVKLDVDLKTGNIRVPVMVELELERILPPDLMKQFDETYGALRAEGRRPGMEHMVKRGLRAQLKTGSLLTGQLFVELDFYPDSPPLELVYGGPQPEIPTVPGALEAFQKTALDLLDNLRKLPLDRIAQELLGTMQGANRLVNAPEWRAAIRSLDATLKDVRTLAQTADRQVAALAADAGKTLGAARNTLESVDPEAPLMIDLANTLEELAAAARSIRTLSDHLERHPESLLYGKGGPAPGAKK
ncbi:MAG: MlaD family protein [Candidatus Competibacter sp.]|nr:MlaD family protein [Candidatus Competibacter sp.]MDG4584255.1 MlaD family protein [Candidatus Competibacter sp.]